MSRIKKYGSIDPEDLLRYLNGEMSDKERHAIEKEILKDPFAADALEGMSIAGTKQVRDDLSDLESRLRKRVSGYGRMIWVRVAASVAVLLTIGTIYFAVFTDKLDMQSRRVADSEKLEPSEEKGHTEEIPLLEQVEETVSESDENTAASELAAAPLTNEVPEISGDKVSVSTVVIKDYEEKFPVGSETGVTEDEERMVSEELSFTDEADVSDTFAFTVSGTGIKSGGEETLIEPSLTENISELESELAAPMARSSVNAKSASPGERLSPGSESRVQEKSKKDDLSAVEMDSEVSAAVYSADTAAAAPVGGWELFHQYISENMQFPDGFESLNAVTVSLIFTIDPEGRPRNIKIKDSPGEPFSREAIRLLESGPDWIPSKINGVFVSENARAKIEIRKEN